MVSAISDTANNTTSDNSGRDITNEVEVDKSDVDIYSIEELVPSSVTITVPYLEIYRTNELEYIPYISPYNTGVQSTSSTDTSSSDTSSDTSSEDSSTDTNTDTSNQQSSSSSTQS